MAQTYQMKHNPQGTIYSLLTVESDGAMTMTFHGTDREICHEANVTEDGRITTGSSLFPGLESGKWNKMDDVRGLTADVLETTEPAEQAVIEETADCADYTDLEPAPVYTDDAELEQLREENQRLQEQIAQMAAEPYRGQSPCNPPSATHTGDSPREPRPRRQRKPRKPAVALDGRTAERTSAIDHQTSDISHQTSSTMKAVGMVAAATVALFVIYETGLLIPLGLIGLATGGILK